MSTIIDSLRMRYLRCSLSNILESRMIPKNFTEVTFGTEILRGGKSGVILLFVKIIY